MTSLSLRKVAELMDCAAAYPAMIEAGERENIGSDVAAKIAALFGTTLDYVVLGTGEPPTSVAVSDAVERAQAALAKRKTDETTTPSGAPQAPTRKTG